MAFPGCGGKEVGRQHFGQDKQSNEPAPDEQAQLDIMPERDKRKDDEHIRHGPWFRGGAAAAAEGDIDVPHGPAIEAAVPASPECERRVVV